ncbi:hypothetical protein LWI28_023937 [Acer negundo]|uniref:Germin-like protein n=1 Tax=Acer negundo TaxID=4023 RepID=A0AAD5JIU6_ACENE|nr:hypothetical protein LWI28_023937 [Acer negundo]KAK4859667.1 hypothetical protein QYF36_009633 [Acer negundo]
MASNMLLAGVLALCFSVALASIVPVQDFCVGDPKGQASVNGLACKDPKLVTPDDFFFSGLDIPGNTSNPFGSKVTSFNAIQIPGLNSLGLSMVRLDLAPYGFNAPHTHPRASEILTVLEGTIEVGFVTGYPDLRHFKKVLNKGDIFIFPFGLIHYQKNVGKGNAVAIAALNSQNAGMIPLAATMYQSQPDICDEIVARSFQLDQGFVKNIQAKQ